MKVMLKQTSIQDRKIIVRIYIKLMLFELFNRDGSFIILQQICKSTWSTETKKNFIKTKGELLDPKTRDFKT